MKVNYGLVLLLIPVVAFISLFIVPLVNILRVSFLNYVGVLDYRPPFTLENYIQLLESGNTKLTFLRTARIALLSSLLAVAVSYPVAFYLSWSTNRKTRMILLSVIMFSLFASTLARGLSWIYILGPEGVAGRVLQLFGAARGTDLLHTELSVIIGLAYVTIPFATLALISPLQKIPRSARDAAMILGASKFEAFIYVTLPLSIPGLTAALAVCLALTLGAFIIPLMLGGGVVDMVSNLIYGRILETLNFPLGAAMSIVLLAFSIAVLYSSTFLATYLTRKLGRA